MRARNTYYVHHCMSRLDNAALDADCRQRGTSFNIFVSNSFKMHVFVLPTKVLVHIPVFARPPPADRSRSSTCASMSSGVEMPPSFSEGL
jgi:hypothetical protein